MQTRALRLYGKNDLRLEEFVLPAMQDDEILAKVIVDGVCTSTLKATKQGSDHKRVPPDIAEQPIIVGHECCGEILAVGNKWQEKFAVGDKFVIQPTLNYQGSPYGPGYSYRYVGGNATYIVIPNEVMEQECLLRFQGESYFRGAVVEPVSCVIAGFKTSYHNVAGRYQHEMGIKAGGQALILNGSGPMGFLAVDYALQAEKKPRCLVVTGTDEQKLARAALYNSVAKAAALGVELHYVNTKHCSDLQADLLALTGGKGYDDVFVYAPLRDSVELGSRLLGHDGCLNFFAGPSEKAFAAEVNFYDVHYAQHHMVGSSGGYPEDMDDAVQMIEQGLVDPAIIVTHIGGLDAARDTILRLPEIGGGKKLIYSHIELPLTALDDFAVKGETEPLFKELADIIARNRGLWCVEAEQYLLTYMTAKD